ncbi:hypothetical protein [Singulisphaera sp. PoT]|uniref:hypothetical protein n=1 Tax=Singulisphaera sp. PoT TaxID=3411797 RepID=UPI003BF55D0C
MESRHLLTSLSDIVVAPSVAADRSGLGSTGTTVVSSPVAGSLTPSQVSQAYGFSQIVFNSGTKSVKGDGTGETIAIVDAYNDPNIAADLAKFDSQYNLPSASLTVVNQSGSTTSLPATDAGWALEISLDVEWAHAMAPGAKILLVEANSSSLSDLTAAVKYASTQANVVSMSWGTGEFLGETSLDSLFNVPGVTFVASSGDSGGISGAEWPAASPNVVSVGGTTLSASTTGTYQGETAWSGYYSQGSGGGLSQYESTPSYQTSVFGNQLPARSTPDVSYDASATNGYAVYDSLGVSGQSGWFEVGGTSAGAPQWSALVAIADQGRSLSGLSSLDSQDTLSLLYSKAATEYQSTPSTYFNDITTGYNAYYQAGRGYDLVTGLGSPKASSLATFLASATTTTTTTTGTTSSGSSGSSGSTHDGPTQPPPHSGPHGPGPRQFTTPTSTSTSTSTTTTTTTTTTTASQSTAVFTVVPTSTTETNSSTSTSTTTASATSTSESTIAGASLGQSLPEPRGTLFLRSATEDQPLARSVVNRRKADRTQATTGTNAHAKAATPKADPGKADPGKADLKAGQTLDSKRDKAPVVPEAGQAPGTLPATPDQPMEVPPPAPSSGEDPEATKAARPALSLGVVIGIWQLWRCREDRVERKRKQTHRVDLDVSSKQVV